MMVDVTASIDSAALASFNNALKTYAETLGENAQNAPKFAAIALCKSLRARTKKAPKVSPKREWAATPSHNPPCYITYRRHQKLDTPLHRWTLARKLGTPAAYAKDHFVYCAYKTDKRGKVIRDDQAELKELAAHYLGIPHAGLAKVSWGKIMQEIYSGSSSITWKKRKGDVRQPMDSVQGSFKKSGTINVSGVAEIHNDLDYIQDALKPGAYSEAIDAAAKNLAFKSLQDQRNADFASMIANERTRNAYLRAKGRI